MNKHNFYIIYYKSNIKNIKPIKRVIVFLEAYNI